MCIKEQFRYWKFFTWSTETYTGCSGITSPPTIVWPALKLVHSTILMSGRSVSISYQSDVKKMSIIDVAGYNPTLDVVGPQRGSDRNLDISPLPWHCLHCVPRQDAQGAFPFILLSPEVENISHRFGTSQGPSLLLLGSETLVLAPFTLLPIVLMCLLSSPLGGIKPATTLRCPKWISTLASV